MSQSTPEAEKVGETPNRASKTPDAVLLIRVFALGVFASFAVLAWQFAGLDDALTWAILALIWLVAVIHRCVQIAGATS